MGALRRLNKVSVKLALLSSILVLGVIGLMAKRLLDGTRTAFMVEKRSRAELFARACREALFPQLDKFQLQFQLTESAKEPGVVYAQVDDPQGRILTHTDLAKVGEADSSEVGRRALAAPGPIEQVFLDPKDRVKYLDFSVPVTVRAKRVGTVRVGFTEDSLRSALAETKRGILIVAAAGILAAVLGTGLIVGWVMRALPVLEAAAREIGRGNLKARVAWTGSDEIGLLARTFNEMAEANANAFTALKAESDKLMAVFMETKEGIVLAGLDGRIVLANPAAMETLGMGATSRAEGEVADTLKDMFAGFECSPPLDQALYSESGSAAFEFKREKPKLLILSGHARRVEAAGQPTRLLVVFRDATHEREEEMFARSILSLVSHKIRTPIMVSQGFEDVLLKEVTNLNDFQKKALETMQVQQGKLVQIIDKILAFADLLKLGSVARTRKVCAPVEVVKQAVDEMAQWMDERGAKLEWDPRELESLPKIDASPQFLALAVKNFMENAVKFNSGKKKLVRVKGSAADGKVRLSVSDNGPGIAPEEHSRLFQKFYQVEEAFTGQVEGAGLGLAYVKQVAAAHGGSVGLKSQVDKGSEFYIELPVNGEKAVKEKKG